MASQRQEESADKRVAKRKKQAKEQQKAAIVPKYHAKQEGSLPCPLPAMIVIPFCLEMAPLFEATELDQVDLFKKQYASFSDGRLDVNAVYPSNHNSQWSLVHCAAYFGSCDMLVYLVDECDGDVERQDPVHLGTALAWAAFGNQLKATKLLISRYKSVMSVKNAQGLTPLDLYLSSTDGEAESQWRSVLAFPPGWSFDRHRLKLALSEVMMLKSGKRKVADLFLSLPLASDYPDYYSIIKKPMCLNQIMSKIMTEASYSISSFVTDFERLIYNARLYNEPSSIVYQDTLLLREAIIYWLGTAYSSHYARIQLAQEDDGGRGGEEDRIDITTPSKTQPSLSMEEYVQNGIVYLPGDTVLISDPTKPSPLKPTVLQIVKFWRNRKEESLMTGMWYLYPEQTFHLPSRKFYETEIFKTKALHEHPASHIIRKCAILPWSEYRKGCPEGVLPEDVFVCDFRYSETGRMIERIRDWEKVTKLDLSRYGKLIPWSVPRNPVRTVHSIFYDPSTAAKSGEENAMLKKAHPAYSSQPYGTKSPLPQHQLPTRPYYQHSPMKASFQQPSPLPAHSLSQQQSSDLLSRPHISSADEARVPFKCRVNRIMIRSYPSLASSYDQKQIFSLTFDPPVYPYTSKTIAPAGMDCLYLFVDKSWRNDPRNEAEANEQAGDSPALPFKNIARGGWSFTEMVFHNAETRIPPMALPSAEVGTATLWSDDWLCFPILLQKGANLIELFTVNQPPAQPKTGQVVIEGDKHVQLSFRLFVIKTPNMAS